MDDFNNIYNEIIKQNRNNEAVFKSRLKKKLNAPINQTKTTT